MSSKQIWIGVVVIAVLFITFVYFPFGSLLEDPSQDGEHMMDDEKMEEVMESVDDHMMDAGVDVMEETMETNAYMGERLDNGGGAVVLDFNRADYEKALAGDKLVVLYFYANWCPICRAEFPKMIDAFDSFDSSEVIGFRVNFNDNDTDDFEVQLAREFGVAYQHTKVFVKDGVRVLKAPDSWDEGRYITEVNKIR